MHRSVVGEVRLLPRLRRAVKVATRPRGVAVPVSPPHPRYVRWRRAVFAGAVGVAGGALASTSGSLANFSFSSHGVPEKSVSIDAEVTRDLDRRDEASDGWETLVHEDDLRVFRRPAKNIVDVPDGLDVYEYRCCGTYRDITPRDFIDAQFDLQCRSSWDSRVLQLVTLHDNADRSQQVIRWVVSYPARMAAREYVYVRRVAVSEDEKIVVYVSNSLPESLYPSDASSSFVRVKCYTSKMTVRAHTSLSEPGFDYVLQYCDNPESNFPKIVYNWIVRRGGPYFLTQVHESAVALSGHRDRPEGPVDVFLRTRREKLAAASAAAAAAAASVVVEEVACTPSEAAPKSSWQISYDRLLTKCSTLLAASKELLETARQHRSTVLEMLQILEKYIEFYE